uniref:DM domain-containing protein n=1 Tax=Acrobeloides nanus TaxID=290746 RepID=A0A914EN04_9BILA
MHCFPIKPVALDAPSTPEDDIDVVSITDKKYFCQRCLNHGEEHPRKGHKPFCRYATCICKECSMVEHRRRLNYELSQAKKDPSEGKKDSSGKRIRDPKCARCSTHGEKHALRGHKRATCPYVACECHLCALVENRRKLMAEQIKLRRYQQKAKKEHKEVEQKQRSSVENRSPPAGTSSSIPCFSNFNTMSGFQFAQASASSFNMNADLKFHATNSHEAFLRNFISSSNANDLGQNLPRQSPLPNLSNMTPDQMMNLLRMMSMNMTQLKPENSVLPLPSPTTEILPNHMFPVVNGCGVQNPSVQNFLNVNNSTFMDTSKISPTSPVLPQPQLLLSFPGIGAIPLATTQPNLAALFQQFQQQLTSSFMTPPMTPPNSLITPNTLF